MKNQPRFSLLALLIFTAVVVIAAKLLYQLLPPAEQPQPKFIEVTYKQPPQKIENEYKYARDANGIKKVHGPRVKRYYHLDGSLDKIVVTYYRQGLDTQHERNLHAITMGGCASGFQLSEPNSELDEFEKVEYEKVIAAEQQRIEIMGFISWEPEYIDHEELRRRGMVIECFPTKQKPGVDAPATR